MGVSGSAANAGSQSLTMGIEYLLDFLLIILFEINNFLKYNY